MKKTKIHLILHLPDSMLRFGPASSFNTERCGEDLVSLYHSKEEVFLDGEVQECGSGIHKHGTLRKVCVPGLHITQGIFLKLFSVFEEACRRIDLKLALYCPTAPLSRSQFDEYSKALKDLSEIISELETVHLEEETFQQLATYCSISVGNFTPFVGSLLELSSNWHERRKVLENQRNLITETVNKSFKMDDGPCIKRVQSCLDSFGVCRQRYYGGIFVGNHVHKILKPSNIEELCSCILTAMANSPELKDEAEAVHARFLTLLKQFSECHSLYDCNATTPDKVQHLDHTIKSFFATFDKEFQDVGRTVKMHILECHTVEWLSLHRQDVASWVSRVQNLSTPSSTP
eukprot:Em0012g511a